MRAVQNQWQLQGYPFADDLLAALAPVEEAGHGDLPKWRAALAALPEISNPELTFTPMLKVTADLSAEESAALVAALKVFHPWRKGPFQLFDQFIDTEWRSDWKWQRVLPHIQPLKGRRVLDVGCGNGYYLWRMLGEGATQVLGVDPMWLFRMQHEVLRHCFGGELSPAQQIEMLPLGVDDLAADAAYFDTVFSMGVLYHRRDPVEHVRQLLAQLRPGGELVLETLVIAGDEDITLEPQGRYAQMRNVHVLPSVSRLSHWLQQAGAQNVRCVDEAVTTTEEQRQSPWMWFHSLPQYLDPSNKQKTLEGHPAPYRAVLVATKALR